MVNITAGNTAQKQACIDSGMIDELVTLLPNDEEKVRKEAIWALSNILRIDSKEYVTALVQKGVLNAFLQSLSINDEEILMRIIEGITCFLISENEYFSAGEDKNLISNEFKRLEGVQKLKELRTHQIQSVREESIKLLKKYFWSEIEPNWDFEESKSPYNAELDEEVQFPENW